MKKVWIVFIVSLLLTACGSEKKETLVVSTWGLNEDILMETVIEPFEKEYDVKVVLETGSTVERFTKLKENPQTEVDVIELSQSMAYEGYDLGLFEPLDESKVPNIAFLIESAQDLQKQNGYGPAYVINSIGIIYHPDRIKASINTWDDFWNPSLGKRLAIPDITTTFGPAIIDLAADLARTPIQEDQGKKAFEKLADLKPQVVKTYAKSSDLAMMFANDEIDAAIVGDFAYGVIKEAEEKVEYLVPQSFTYANFNTMEVNKHSKKKDLAYQFINYRLDKETQAITSPALNEAPVNKEVVLDEQVVGNMTYGPVAQRARALDYGVINPLMPEWIDQFNRLMNH